MCYLCVVLNKFMFVWLPLEAKILGFRSFLHVSSLLTSSLPLIICQCNILGKHVSIKMLQF